MVKNTTGGNKSKGYARKNVMAAKQERATRMSKDENEIYAQVRKMLGNGMCEVLCADNVSRLCHIRGKFRGRGKKDNFITAGTLLLIGLREWESGEVKKGKLPNCDLLEVYSDSDKVSLKKNSDINWALFTSEFESSSSKKLDDELDFIDESTMEYRELMENEIANITTSSGTNRNIITITLNENGDNNEINIDDI
jgi:translation initiation factor 1A